MTTTTGVITPRTTATRCNQECGFCPLPFCRNHGFVISCRCRCIRRNRISSACISFILNRRYRKTCCCPSTLSLRGNRCTCVSITTIFRISRNKRECQFMFAVIGTSLCSTLGAVCSQLIALCPITPVMGMCRILYRDFTGQRLVIRIITGIFSRIYRPHKRILCLRIIRIRCIRL